MKVQNILLIEDTLDLGDLLVYVLEREGHAVSWYVRARITPEGLMLMEPRGKEVLIDASVFNIAFVDYRLKGSPINGPEVTAELVKSKLPVIAMSGLPSLNEEMIERGAVASCEKHTFSLGLNEALKHARSLS